MANSFILLERIIGTCHHVYLTILIEVPNEVTGTGAEFAMEAMKFTAT
jgi:hypothetical protein